MKNDSFKNFYDITPVLFFFLNFDVKLKCRKNEKYDSYQYKERATCILYFEMFR